MPVYSKPFVQDQVRNALKEIQELYQKSFVNWRGKASCKTLYSEIVAEELIKLNIASELKKIPVIDRKSYAVATHDGEIARRTPRKEEILAKELFTYCKKNSLGDLGMIFDYQVPLKSIRGDKAGKIDLVSVSNQDNKIYLIELKTDDNKETLLRCILEIATYYQQLHKDNFIASYPNALKGFTPASIFKAVLVCEGSTQHDELQEIKAGKRPHLKQLADILDISFHLVDYKAIGINL